MGLEAPIEGRGRVVPTLEREQVISGIMLTGLTEPNHLGFFTFKIMFFLCPKAVQDP